MCERIVESKIYSIHLLLPIFFEKDSLTFWKYLYDMKMYLLACIQNSFLQTVSDDLSIIQKLHASPCNNNGSYSHNIIIFIYFMKTVIYVIHM